MVFVIHQYESSIGIHVSLSSLNPPPTSLIPLLQYSCLENSTGRGAWKAKVHGLRNGQT